MVAIQNLSYGRRSNLSAGVVNNVDFVILALAQGPVALSALYAALSSFRGKAFNKNGQVGSCSYLFNRQYGYVGSCQDSAASTYGKIILLGGHRTPYWYRVRRGTYALTTAGLARLAQLQAS